MRKYLSDNIIHAILENHTKYSITELSAKYGFSRSSIRRVIIQAEKYIKKRIDSEKDPSKKEKYKKLRDRCFSQQYHQKNKIEAAVDKML